MTDREWISKMLNLSKECTKRKGKGNIKQVKKYSTNNRVVDLNTNWGGNTLNTPIKT